APDPEARREPQFLDDVAVWPRRQLADEDRGAEEEQREEHEVVEHLVADRLAEHGDRHDARRPHRAPSPMAATLRTNTSSSVSRTGFSDTSVAPADVSSRSSSSGRPSGGRSIEYRSAAMVTTPRARSLTRSSAPAGTFATTSSQPCTANSCMSASRPAAARRPFATIATRLQSVSASERMCELKKM